MYSDFSFKSRKFIKNKYYNQTGIYLWINSINNKSYVGKSVNLFNRLNKNYLSKSYVFKNKGKMAICAAIHKYGITKFSFYILEILDKPEVVTLSSKEFLSIRENYWHSLINPSYNIQTILNPFTGVNHYRYGKTVSYSIKSKISKTLKGRVQTDTEKTNHILGAHKKKIYCYDWETKILLMEFEGLRIMERIVNRNHSYIRTKLDKNKPFCFFVILMGLIINYC